MKTLVFDIDSYRMVAGYHTSSIENNAGNIVPVPELLGYSYICNVDGEMYVGGVPEQCVDLPVQKAMPDDGIFDRFVLSRILGSAAQQLAEPVSKARVILVEPPSLSEDVKQEITALLLGEIGVSAVSWVPFIEIVKKIYEMNDGIILNLGNDSVFAVTMTNGELVPDSLISTNLSGSRLLIEFLNYLIGLGIPKQVLAFEFEWNLVSRMQVAFDMGSGCSTMRSLNNTFSYEVDGESTTITLGDELTKIPEMLFQPDMLGISGNSIVDAILQSAEKASAKSNIVMIYGNLSIDGITARLLAELGGHIENVNIISYISHQIQSWSSVAGFPIEYFDDKWVS